MEETRRLYPAVPTASWPACGGGLPEHFNTDPTLIRVLFVVLAALGGPGLLIYLVLWIVVPEEPLSGA